MNRLIFFYLLFPTLYIEHNITGRLYESNSNTTFSRDLVMTVYEGFGEYNKTSFVPYEKLEMVGNGEYYTGYYELIDLPTGSYIAIAEAYGYHSNF